MFQTSTFLQKRAIGILALLVLATVPYLLSLGNGFVGMDDGLLILDNPIVHGFNLQNIKAAFSSYDPELYIPLTLISYQLNYLVDGLNPFGYHFVNLLLHAGNVLLLAWVMTLIGCKRTTAFWIAALFAVHPLNTETVAWASARKDLLSSFFLLWSFGAYLMYRREESLKWYIAGILLALLGMLSKVTVIMLPALLLLTDWYMHRPLRGRGIIEKIPHFALSIIFLTVAMFGKQLTGSSFVWEKILIGCKAAFFYIGKFFVPSGLSILYPYTQNISLWNPDILLSLIGMITVTAISILALVRWKMRLPLFAWTWFLLLLLPTFNTIARGRNEQLDIYFASDRYAYLPIIGLLLFLGLILERRLREHQTIALSALCTLTLIAGIITFNQSLVWKDSFALFSHTIRYYPNSYVAYTNVGSELYARGDIDGAFTAYGKALKIRPNAVAYYNVGQILLGKGQPEQAMAAYRRAIESSPLHLEAHLQLARLLIAAGQQEEALRVLQSAEEIAPENAEIQGIRSTLR